ncbi:MAG: 50S ribosomal protein L5 [Candidatus Buchananbacteria bacterium]|nr:50S ribosomal protein L5 [Candidatus Buchananbacteria bacterium]
MSLKEYYKKEVAPQLKESFGYTNNLAVPKLKKVVLNAGLGKGVKDSSFMETVENTLTRITGQKPVKTKAKKSISNFKIREGMVIGMKVTLRGETMYDFIEKLIKITLPRVRDFRGLSLKSIDKEGNLNIGIKEHIAFPEIQADEIEKLHGLEMAIVTTAKNREEGEALFKALGFPFKKK